MNETIRTKKIKGVWYAWLVAGDTIHPASLKRDAITAALRHYNKSRERALLDIKIVKRIRNRPKRHKTQHPYIKYGMGMELVYLMGWDANGRRGIL